MTTRTYNGYLRKGKMANTSLFSSRFLSKFKHMHPCNKKFYLNKHRTSKKEAKITELRRHCRSLHQEEACGNHRKSESKQWTLTRDSNPRHSEGTCTYTHNIRKGTYKKNHLNLPIRHPKTSCYKDEKNCKC